MSLPKSIGTLARRSAALGIALQWAWMAGLSAQTLRDPTQAPVQMRPPAMAASGVAGATGADAAADDTLPGLSDGIAVVLREGKPYLVYGTRLYGVGQKIEGYRIERISETQVWIRSASGLKKLERFPEIQRSVVNPANEECLVAPAKEIPQPATPAKARAKRPVPSSTPVSPAASAAASTPPAPDTLTCPSAKP